MAAMTPRERVLASINHQNPESLPLDLGSNVSCGISGQAYGRLKEYLGITTGHNRIYDVVQQVAQPEIQILDIIGADVLDVGRVYNAADEDWYDVTLSGGIPAQWPAWFRPVQNPDGSYVTITADFRKYPCVEDSIADHSAYLLGAMNGSKQRYSGLKGCADYKKAAQIIKDGGYAWCS